MIGRAISPGNIFWKIFHGEEEISKEIRFLGIKMKLTEIFMNVF